MITYRGRGRSTHESMAVFTYAAFQATCWQTEVCGRAINGVGWNNEGDWEGDDRLEDRFTSIPAVVRTTTATAISCMNGRHQAPAVNLARESAGDVEAGLDRRPQCSTAYCCFRNVLIARSSNLVLRLRGQD